MIRFHDVSFSYPDSSDSGLKHIDLTIPDGQCVLLCGRSGCGKTTLTRLLNGLIPQFFAGELTGDVELDGQSLLELPLYRIAEQVGSVFQNPRTQFFNVDTDSEIAFGLENQALPQNNCVRGWRRPPKRWTSHPCWGATSSPCPVGRSRRSPSPRCMPWNRRFFCWTNPPPTWT